MATERKTETPAIAAEILIGTLADAQTGLMLPSGLRLKFSDGRTLELQVERLSPGIIAQAIVHGLKQKLVDAAAIARDPETGRAATIDTKFTAVHEVYSRLLSGEWNKKRDGAGGSGGLLFRALARMYDGKKTADELRAWLDGKTDAEKAQLRKNPKVAAIIEEIRAEQAKDGDVNSDDLLAELGE